MGAAETLAAGAAGRAFSLHNSSMALADTLSSAVLMMLTKMT
jgi:hypothetical protein